MSNPTSNESAQGVQLFNPPYASLPLRNTDSMPMLLSGDAVVTEKAQCRAIDDTVEVSKLERSGNFVVVNWVKVGDRAMDIAQEEVRAYRATALSLAPEEYKRLKDVCQKAYVDYLESELTENVTLLRDSHEVRLRDLAIRDRYAEPHRSSNHIRDLGIVRVLIEFAVPFDAAPDQLHQLHRYVDIYQAYYINPREEVEWPIQKTFRGE